jgi:hypothetical protein
MDHLKILKRALSISWSYRVLWLFGFLLALTLPRARPSSNVNYEFNRSDFNGWQGFPHVFPGISPQVVYTLLGIGVALLCMFILLAIAGTVVRYISETALIRMVDQYEASSEQVNVGGGFRLGWSQRAFRLFLIDLLVGIVGVVVFLLLLAIAATPLLVWLTNSPPLHTLGSVVAIGLIFLVILAFILVAIVVSVVIHFMRRAAVLEDRGVFESIRRGLTLVRQRLGDIVIMALILFALRLGWIVLSIPIIILLVLAGVILGGVPALLAWLATNLFAQGALPWIAAALIGLPIFLVVLIIPGNFIGGLFETYTSSAWTLTYREVVALSGDQPALPTASPEAPAADTAEDEAA